MNKKEKEKLENILNIFDALSQISRIKIFKILVANSKNGITPTEISKLMQNIPRNTLSFHLSTMMDVGLCSSFRKGKQIFYKSNCKKIKEITKFLLIDCCAGKECENS